MFVVVCQDASLASRFNLAYEFSNLFGTQKVWTDSPAVALVLSFLLIVEHLDPRIRYNKTISGGFAIAQKLCPMLRIATIIRK